MHKMGLTPDNVCCVVESPGGVTDPPSVLIRRLARVEASLFEAITRQAEDVLAGRTRRPLVCEREGAPLHVEERLYNTAQISRLAAALAQSLTLAGFPVDTDFFCINSMTWCVCFSDLTSMAKQFTAWPLAAKQLTVEGHLDVPKHLDGWNYEYLLGPKIRRFVKGRVLNPSPGHIPESLILAECFLRDKRSANVVSPVFVLKALKDHGTDLSKTDESLVEMSRRLNKPLEMIEGEMTRIRGWIDLIVDQVLPKKTTKVFLPPSLPSGKSAFGTSRKKGGAAVAALRDFSLEIPDIDDEGDLVTPGHYPNRLGARWMLDRMTYSPRDGVKSHYLPDFQIEPQELFSVRGTPDFDHWLDEFYDRESPMIQSQVVAVLEPLKVRPITKGEATPYLEARRLQEFITGRMKICPLKNFFPSLRGPITADTLNELLCLSAFSHPEVLSGDYKGASDRLRRDLSEYTIGRFCQELPQYQDPRVRQLMLSCLVDHRLIYKFEGQPDWGQADVRLEWSVDQKKGQLMGSFLSFGVLNIINLAVNLSFLEMAGKVKKSMKLSDFPIFVNGDDVIAAGELGTFSCRQGGFLWEEYVSLAGFIKSLGKNYVSDQFATVNSLLFQISDRKFLPIKCPRIERAYNESWKDTFNVGRCRPGDDEEPQAGPQMVGGLVRDLLLSVPRDRHELAVRLFIELNKRALKQVGLPWFLPEDLGGLGIPALPEMQDEWRGDALLAAYFLRVVHQGGRLETFSDELKKSRGCDAMKSKLDMLYLKSQGWRQEVVVRPTEEQLLVHASRPRAPVSDWDMVTFGLVPEKQGPCELEFAALHMRRSIGKANAAKCLVPMDLAGTVRVLWMPKRLYYSRVDTPSETVTTCGDSDEEEERGWSEPDDQVLTDDLGKEINNDPLGLSEVQCCQFCGSHEDPHMYCDWYRK
jgi:hypothetical protein